MSVKILEFKKMDEKTKEHVHKDLKKVFASVCQNTIELDYFNEIFFEETDFIYLSYAQYKDKPGSLKGFALVQKKPTYFYISIICSNKKPMVTRANPEVVYGAELVETIKKHAKSLRRMKSVKLDALPHVITFYKMKLGFEIDGENKVERNKAAEDFFNEFKKTKKYKGANFESLIDDYKVARKPGTDPLFRPFSIMILGKVRRNKKEFSKLDEHGLPMIYKLKNL